MNIKQCMKPLALSRGASTALLFLRLVVGIAFIFHGWGKIQAPFGWMGADAPVPGFLQLLAAVAEFGGGIALVLGLLTALASTGLFVTMLVAVYFHAVIRGDPFVSSGGSSYELALVYLSVSALFISVGAGQWAADYKLFGPRAK